MATQNEDPRAALAALIAGRSDDEINAITHRNAMRHFSFDPFAHRSAAESTVGALRALATHVDTAPVPRFQRYDPPTEQLTLTTLLERASHPLLDDQKSRAAAPSP